jgi:ubiquitin-protein ligase
MVTGLTHRGPDLCFSKDRLFMPIFKRKKELDANPNRQHRLQSDFEQVSKCFQNHPHIMIKQAFGSPPEKYHITYLIDGLAKDVKSIEAKNEHSVEIVLPRNYPESSPACTRLSPIFHPNIAPEIIDIKEHWTSGSSLADCIVLIAEMICFQKYNTDNPINEEAAKWVLKNKSLLPLSTVDLRCHLPEAPANGTPAAEVSVHEQSAPETPSPEDARKTESIEIEPETPQISIKSDTRTMKTQDNETLEQAKTATLPAVEMKKSILPQQEEDKVPAPQDVPKEQAAAAEVKAEKVVLANRKNWIYCWQCGSINSKEANFCMQCGTKLSSRQSGILKKGNETVLLAVLTAIPAAIVITGLVLIFTHKEHPGMGPDSFAPAAVQSQEQPQAQVPAGKAKESAPVKDTSVVKDSAVGTGAAKEPAKAAAPEKPRTRQPAVLTEQQKQERIEADLKNARLYTDLGSYEEAEKRYMSVLKLDPKNDDAIDGLQKIRDAKEKAAENEKKGPPPQPPQ